MEDKKYCKFCGEKIRKDAVVCPKCGRQLEFVKEEIKEEGHDKKPNANTEKFYEKLWFMWVMLFFVPPVGIFFMWKFNKKYNKTLKIILTIIFSILFITAISSGSTDSGDNNTDNNKNKVKVQVADFSTMTVEDATVWCETNKVTCNIRDDYSDTIGSGKLINQSVGSTQTAYEGDTIIITYSLGKEPSTEFKNALKKAESYSTTLHMSKQGIYEQLTSYVEKFSEDAAQYAIDNVQADWNANALAKAKSYQDTMSMSKSAIYEQLTSFVEKFTASEAQYAIEHLDD